MYLSESPLCSIVIETIENPDFFNALKYFLDKEQATYACVNLINYLVRPSQVINNVLTQIQLTHPQRLCIYDYIEQLIQRVVNKDRLLRFALKKAVEYGVDATGRMRTNDENVVLPVVRLLAKSAINYKAVDDDGKTVSDYIDSPNTELCYELEKIIKQNDRTLTTPKLINQTIPTQIQSLISGCIVGSPKDLLLRIVKICTTSQDETNQKTKADIRTLVKSSFDINACFGDGKTALMWAAEYGMIDIVKTLLEYRADLTKTDKHGRTALMYAAHYGHHEVVELLYESVHPDLLPRFLNAQVRYDFDPYTIKNNIVTYDLRYGRGITALYFAVENGYVDIVRTLLSYGATKDVDRSVNNTIDRCAYAKLARATEKNDHARIANYDAIIKLLSN